MGSLRTLRIDPEDSDYSRTARAGFFDSAAFRRQREAVAIHRVIQQASADKLELSTAEYLEKEFFRLQSENPVHESTNRSLRCMCEGASSAVETSFRKLQDMEASIYVDLPRTHPEYQKLIELQNSLESELVAWKVVLALAANRSQRSADYGWVPPVDLQDHSEEEFVDNWSKCQSVLSDIKIVMNVFERCSADCHSQEFQLSSLKSRPIPPRAFLAQEAKQLKLKAQRDHMKPAVDFPPDEDIFKAVFKSMRGGDLEAVEELVKTGGLSMFGLNFTLRKYLKKSGSILQERNGNSRLRWKVTAWKVSQDAILPPWQRAVWGVLCGNYAAAIPVAESWEDEAWIYFHCFIDYVVEQALALRGANADFSQMDSILPEEYWKSGLSIPDIFQRMAASRNEVVRFQSDSVFRRSITAAVINDLQEALVEIYEFILETSDLLPPPGVLVQNQRLTLKAASEARFTVHMLFLIEKVGVPVDPACLGRACQLYVRTAVTGDPSLWAFYACKIPDAYRPRAVEHFFSNYVSNPEDKQSFIRALFAIDRDCAIMIARTFIRHGIFTKVESADMPPSEVIVDLFDLFYEVPDPAQLLLSAANRLVRLYLLEDPPDALAAFNLFEAIKGPLDKLMDLADSKLTAISHAFESAGSETFCLRRYLEIIEKFSEFRGMDNTGYDFEDLDSRKNMMEDIITAGYHITSTKDWLKGTNTEEEPDRFYQLESLRKRTILEVYASLMKVLDVGARETDEEAKIEAFKSIMDLTAFITDYADVDLMPVEEELKRVNDYADQIIRNPTSSIVTPDLRRIARTTREKVYDALAAMSPLKGVS